MFLHCEDLIDQHRLYAYNSSNCEINAKKNSGLNGIRTHDLGDTRAFKPSGSWLHCEFVINYSCRRCYNPTFNFLLPIYTPGWREVHIL